MKLRMQIERFQSRVFMGERLNSQFTDPPKFFLNNKEALCSHAP